MAPHASSLIKFQHFLHNTNDRITTTRQINDEELLYAEASALTKSVWTRRRRVNRPARTCLRSILLFLDGNADMSPIRSWDLQWVHRTIRHLNWRHAIFWCMLCEDLSNYAMPGHSASITCETYAKGWIQSALYCVMPAMWRNEVVQRMFIDKIWLSSDDPSFVVRLECAAPTQLQNWPPNRYMAKASRTPPLWKTGKEYKKDGNLHTIQPFTRWCPIAGVCKPTTLSHSLHRGGVPHLFRRKAILRTSQTRMRKYQTSTATCIVRFKCTFPRWSKRCNVFLSKSDLLRQDCGWRHGERGTGSD